MSTKFKVGDRVRFKKKHQSKYLGSYVVSSYCSCGCGFFTLKGIRSLQFPLQWENANLQMQFDFMDKEAE